jgi:hypothetical protein
MGRQLTFLAFLDLFQLIAFFVPNLSALLDKIDLIDIFLLLFPLDNPDWPKRQILEELIRTDISNLRTDQNQLENMLATLTVKGSKFDQAGH